MICFRAKSVSVRGLPGRPKIEVTMRRGPVRLSRSRVEIQRSYWDQVHPDCQNRVQEIDAPDGVLFIEE